MMRSIFGGWTPFRTGFALILLTLALAASPAYSRRKSSLAAAIGDKIDAALVAPPEDQEVCFAPDEPCGTKLAKFIASAKKSLDIAIYDINLDEFVHQVMVKSKSIPVRMVVDRKQAKGEHSAVALLMKAGVNLRYGHQRGIMHNKFVIVDGEAVETGSFNYTHHAATANNENQVYLKNPRIVARFVKRFEHLWENGDEVQDR